MTKIIAFLFAGDVDANSLPLSDTTSGPADDVGDLCDTLTYDNDLVLVDGNVPTYNYVCSITGRCVKIDTFFCKQELL